MALTDAFGNPIKVQPVLAGVPVDVSHPLPVGALSGPDYTNTTSTPLAANATFLGAWQYGGDLGGLYSFYEADAALTTAQIEFSDDGISANGTELFLLAQPIVGGFLGLLTAQSATWSGQYYRLHLTCGPVPQTFLYATVRRGQTAATGSLLSLNDPVSSLSISQLVRSVQAGSDPAGNFRNISLPGQDPTNSTETLLTANTSISLANGTVNGTTAITTATSFFTPAMSGLGVTDSLGLIPAGTTLTYVSATSATLSQAATGSSTVDQFTSAHAPPAGATYTGAWTNVSSYESMLAFAFADQNWATLKLEWSTDGVTQDASLLSTSSLLPASPFIVGLTTYHLALSVPTTMVRPYYRLVAVNGPVAQTLGEIDVWLYTGAFPGSYAGLSSTLSSLSTALLTRSVVAAYDPDGNFDNIRAQGRDSGNSTSTPLAANATFRGKWFPWQGTYVKAAVDMSSDVAGTFYFDLSEQATPVDGDDSSVTSSLSGSYDPTRDVLLRRQYPVQSHWYRIRYVNGVAAQANFLLDVALLINDPGLTQSPLSNVPGHNNLAGRVRSVLATPTGDGTGYQELPVDALGIPKSHVATVDDDLLLRGLPTTSVRQIQVGTSAVQLDATKLANRRSVAIANLDESTIPVAVYIGHSSSITVDSSTFPIYQKTEKGGAYGTNVDLWAICKNTGGVNVTRDLSGTTAGGTGTNPNNALVSDNTYATVSQSQTVDVSGYTDPSIAAIVSVKICAELSKQSGQVETVAFLDVATGNAGNVGTVISTTVTHAPLMCYLAYISRESSVTVTGVLGLGLTWTQVATEPSDDAHRTLDLWRAVGSAAADGVVTASFSVPATNSHIAVLRFSGVDQTTPVQDFHTNNANSTAVTTAALNSTNKGMAVLGVAEDNTTNTAGAGYTERSDQQSGSGTIDGLATETKPLVSTGTETPTATLAGAKHYAAIAATLTPAAGYDPVATVSYKLSGVAGASSQAFAVTSTSDVIRTVDVTGDHSWVPADLPNVDVIVTGTTVTSALAQIDWIFVEIVDTTANTVRLALREIA